MSNDPIHAFDWLFGTWRVRHRRLKERLANNDQWEEFDGSSTAQPLMGGMANMDDNVVNIPSGSYHGVSLRCFDAKTNRWAIWWLDSRFPDKVEPPVYGSFKDGIGTFIGDDTFKGKPIKVRFIWNVTNPNAPHWQQAFSPDGGKTWETNWYNYFTRTR